MLSLLSVSDTSPHKGNEPDGVTEESEGSYRLQADRNHTEGGSQQKRISFNLSTIIKAEDEEVMRQITPPQKASKLLGSIRTGSIQQALAITIRNCLNYLCQKMMRSTRSLPDTGEVHDVSPRWRNDAYNNLESASPKRRMRLFRAESNYCFY